MSFLTQLLGLALLLFTACDTINPASENEHQENLALLPTDIWIAEAQLRLANDQTNDDGYFLLASLGVDAPDIRMDFNSTGFLNSIQLATSDQKEHTFYIEESHLIFSHHSNNAQDEVEVYAYANEEPYAAATEISEVWKPISPKPWPLDPSVLRAALKLAFKYEQREQNGHYKYRFKKQDDQYAGYIGSQEIEVFALNAKKGDEIAIQLRSNTENVYFMIEPHYRSDMEHTFYKTQQLESGDIKIKVFSLEKSGDVDFVLKTQLVSQQNPKLAQAL